MNRDNGLTRIIITDLINFNNEILLLLLDVYFYIH